MYLWNNTIFSSSSERSLIFTSAYVNSECTCISKQALTSIDTSENVDKFRSTANTILHNLNQASEADDKNFLSRDTFCQP